MTSACHINLIRKPKNAPEVPESRGGCLKKDFLLNPLLISLEILLSVPCFPWGGVVVVLTIDVLREASVSPVSPALVPFFQAPGRSVIASPMGWHGTEKREAFEVEVSCTNGIITPGNHLQSNYGLLLACSSCPPFKQ